MFQNTVVRRFSTSGIVSATSKLAGLEGRYAQALFTAATKAKKIDVVEKDLRSFQSAVTSNPKLVVFLDNPSLKRDVKKTTMLDIAKSQKYDQLTQNLFGVLCDNGRLNHSVGIVKAFEKLMNSHRGEVQCVVISARPLDAAQLKKVEQSMHGFLKSGQKLVVETKVDPALLGGLIVQIGDKFVDMSIASKMKRYTKVLRDTV